MRIQHNILAMNSYRNYSNNTNALGRNLEKLSSGYKINRAGDDAAGLAISEKMRAQIQGLNAAQKNVKDGISLVKTAEGAMQEIQDMMSRMKYLATQSANGTYDDSVDRKALQDEVNQLRDEINRIADSSNFNGTKLLDGSLSGSGSTSSSSGGGGSSASGVKFDVALTASGGPDGAVVSGTATKKQKTSVSFATITGTFAKNETFKVELEMSDGSKYTFEFAVKNSTTLTYKGKDLGVTFSSLTETDGVTAEVIGKAVAEALKLDDNFKSKYDIDATTAAGTLTLTSKKESFDDPSIKVVTVTGKNKSTPALGTVSQTGVGDYSKLDVSKLKVYDAAASDKSVEDSVITINGQKFAIVKDDASAKELGPDVNVVVVNNATSGIATVDAKALGKLINQKTGANIDLSKITGKSIDLISKGGVDGVGGDSSSSSSSSGGAGGLKLQIGDTADSYNQLVVTVNDMHTAAIGIDSIDISGIDSAAAAIDVIKDGINYVSSTRGTLGAIQNRLEHTQNNLSVMAENIQDAESTIRDTDVADEMMGYVKNNILIQSAQAMLAQANQVPQGVLQLLG